VIPKPNKPDYSAPKAYRPISLLECIGKLLEKIVAKRVMSDLNCLNILPPLQFGSWDFSSAVDGAGHLHHLVHSCIASDCIAATIFFDIQGFFDNLCPARSASLSFNNYTHDPADLSFGTPQGSPLSPILSALYTAPLLSLLNASDPSPFTSFQLYVDDGCITASGETYRSAAGKAAAAYERAASWLFENGLRLDCNKTDFMCFCGRHSEARFGPVLSRIALRDPFNGEFPVPASPVVRYLGVFFTPTLDWRKHVTIMASRV
jgi:Reverse transcriptase (RNA-dependent DNA polymerase)